MPKLSEINGCLAADRADIRKRIEKIPAKKFLTKKDIYSSLLKLKRHIDKNFAEEMTTKSMAHFCAMSEFKMIREFKSLYEVTPGEYLADRRLRTAEKLVLKGTLSITEIALSTGWVNLTSFNRAFKKKFEVSPTLYKKSNLR